MYREIKTLPLGYTLGKGPVFGPAALAVARELSPCRTRHTNYEKFCRHFGSGKDMLRPSAFARARALPLAGKLRLELSTLQNVRSCF